MKLGRQPSGGDTVLTAGVTYAGRLLRSVRGFSPGVVIVFIGDKLLDIPAVAA